MASYPPQAEPQCTMEVSPNNIPLLGHEGHPTYYKGYASPPKLDSDLDSYQGREEND